MNRYTLSAMTGLGLILAGPAFSQDIGVNIHPQADQNQLPAQMQEDPERWLPSVDPLPTASVEPGIQSAPPSDVTAVGSTDYDPLIEDPVNSAVSGMDADAVDSGVNVHVTADRNELPPEMQTNLLPAEPGWTGMRAASPEVGSQLPADPELRRQTAAADTVVVPQPSPTGANGTIVAQATTVEPGDDRNELPEDLATPSSPEEFATMAAHSNLFEIESSRLALEASQEDAVRQFAQRMIDDHTMASQEMMSAAATDGVTNVPDSLDPRHQQMLTQLQNASPEEFDSLYLQMQVAAHQEAVTLFGNYAEEEGALADFAGATLPTLEEHLAMVQQLAS